MGFFDLFETREEKQTYDTLELRKAGPTNIEGGDAFSLMRNAIKGNSGSGEIQLSQENIMTIPTVANCVSLISAGIAQLPVDLCYYNEDGSVTKVADDNRIFLLNDEPNESLNSFLLKEMMVKDYIINGNSYVVVERSGNEVKGLYPIPSKDIKIEKFKDGYKTSAKISLDSLDIAPEDLIITLKDSIDGFEGNGVLTTGEEILKLALGEIYYSQSLLENGAIPTGVVTVPSKLSPQAFTNIKNSWQKNFGGAKNAGKTAILENGAEYKSISLRPNDLDLTASKKNTVTEICKLFSVPESMVNANANKYGGVESNSLQFLQFCIGPIVKSLECSLNKSLLLEDEKLKGYFFRFDTSELVRTVESEKVETLAKAVKGKLISVNEARGKLGYKSMPKDFWIYGLGDVLYSLDSNLLVNINSGLGINPDEALTPEAMAELKEKYKSIYKVKTETEIAENTTGLEGENTPKEEPVKEEKVEEKPTKQKRKPKKTTEKTEE